MKPVHPQDQPKFERSVHSIEGNVGPNVREVISQDTLFDEWALGNIYTKTGFPHPKLWVSCNCSLKPIH